MVYRNTSKGACTPPTAQTTSPCRQDAAASAIDVLANDTGGLKFAVSVTQPAHGVTAMAGGTLTYRPDADYCNDLGGVPDTFTYTLNGGSSATVASPSSAPTPPGGPDLAAVLPPPPPPRSRAPAATRARCLSSSARPATTSWSATPAATC